VAVCEGKIEYKSEALEDEEKKRGDVMLSCVDRGVGRIVVDL
jgi:hypothetical protein